MTETLIEPPAAAAPGPAAAELEPKDEASRQGTPFLVLQFFIFPMAIVAVCVAVFVIFGLIATGPKDPRAILAEVRTGGGLFNVKRWQAAYALANALESEKDLERARQDPGFVPEVIDLYRETADATGDDLLVRRYLAVALGRLADPRAVTELRRTLQTASPPPDEQTVIYSVWALGAIADPAALSELLPLAASADAGLRKAAVHALGSFADPRAEAVLAAGLQDDAVDVRWNAAVALARRGDARAAPILLQMLDREHLAAVPELTQQQREEAVLQAVEAAAALQAPELRAALARLRDGDPNVQVREAARRALESPRLTVVGSKVE